MKTIKSSGFEKGYNISSKARIQGRQQALAEVEKAIKKRNIYEDELISVNELFDIIKSLETQNPLNETKPVSGDGKVNNSTSHKIERDKPHLEDANSRKGREKGK